MTKVTKPLTPNARNQKLMSVFSALMKPSWTWIAAHAIREPPRAPTGAGFGEFLLKVPIKRSLNREIPLSNSFPTTKKRPDKSVLMNRLSDEDSDEQTLWWTHSLSSPGQCYWQCCSIVPWQSYWIWFSGWEARWNKGTPKKMSYEEPTWKGNIKCRRISEVPEHRVISYQTA